MLAPPAAESLSGPDTHYAAALERATEVVALDNRGTVYAWLFLPSRITWPVAHVDRPAPTPGCGCAPCHRPRCCGTWAEPVELITGETVAWICPTCLDVLPTGWGCTDCEWVEDRRLCDPAPRPLLARPCKEHA